MKRTRFWHLVLWIGILLLPVALRAQVDDDDDDDSFGAREPVQLYLMASITDHVNITISEDRLRHILAMLEKYRQAHPRSGIGATILFSGSVSEALQNRNSQTHLVDMVKEYVQRRIIEVGYDGTDEPTYVRRPLIEIKADSAEGHWMARATAAEKFLTEARDPLTGAPLPGTVGGLKKMQEVFGEAACITGIRLRVPTLANTMPDFGSQSEAVHQLRRYNTHALMFGLPDENPLHSVAYRGWSTAFSNDLSPLPITPPELFWEDGVLRTSESVGVDNQLFLANNGPAAFSYVIKRLDRNKIRVIHIELASERNYLTKPFREEFMYPPTRYAYAHPEHPQLPPAALQKQSTVDAAYAREDELIGWLIDDFLPDHPESHFVSNAGLVKMTLPATGFDVPVKGLRAAVGKVLEAWGDQKRPPKYLNVKEFYFLSLAETFQVLADALAAQNRTGELPETVRVAEVHGPLQAINDVNPVLGEVTAASVARAAAALDGALHDDAWSPVPHNVVPMRVKVEGLDLNPAQFLRLMAEALVAPSPDTRLKVKPENMFASQNFVKIRTRSALDMGNVWTYKPAALLLNGPAVSASN